MRTMQEYRHTLDKKTKEAFLKSFKLALKKIDKNKFSFIGLVGSIEKETSHDIDIIIFPSKDTKIGESIIELSKLYEEAEKELKKHHKRYYIVASPRFAMQEMTHHIAAGEEGAPGMIPVHSMFFTNYRDFKKFSPKKFIGVVEKESLVLYGSLTDAKKIIAIPQKKIEPYFFILDFEMNSKVNNFPRHLIRSSAESLFEYLEKKYNLKTIREIPHNIKEIEKEFIRLLKELDKITYS